MKPSLPFFEPKKGFYISPESSIAIGLPTLLFLIFYLKTSLGFDFGNLTIYMSIICVIYCFAFMFSNFFRHEREIGEYKGMIRFGKSSISFNNKVYKLNDIEKMSFSCNVIKGETILYTRGLSPSLSNGLNNSITLKLIDGTKVEAAFLQTKTRRLKFYKEILIFYYLENKFSWLHLLDVLEMNNYEEIQIFKNEIH